MAFDGISARAFCRELKDAALSGRIEKIHQPERDEIILIIHNNQSRMRLCCCCNSNYPRIHFTEHAKENPLSAPMFCMLLRKHLQSGRIADIADMGLERALDLMIESTGELGDREQKHLIVEIMGRHSNIILTDGEYKIIDSMKRVDFTVSTVRQILPGHLYSTPPAQHKQNPLDLDETTFYSLLTGSENTGRIDKFLLNTLKGVSPLICREILYQSAGDTALHFEEANAAQLSKLAGDLAAFFDRVKNNQFQSVVLLDSDTRKPFDFSPLPILQYGALKAVQNMDSLSQAMDFYYTQKDALERLTQKKAALHKLLSNLKDRCTKKIILQEESLSQTARMDEYKQKGDLLFANLYRVPEGSRSFETENFYGGGETVSIELDENKTPAQNAALYYDKYTKAKNTRKAVTGQLKKSCDEMEYLESVYESLALAQNDLEIGEIKEELAQNGYVKRSPEKKKAKNQAQSQPLCFRSTDGYLIWVGKNNRQNDQLTLKTAKNSDLWFHTKNIPGSHTVLLTNGEKDIPDRAVLEAAMICAFHSKARQSSQVPVDYTVIKNVKKPGGAKPGMVIYDDYQTVYVTPDESTIEQLKRP